MLATESMAGPPRILHEGVRPAHPVGWGILACTFVKDSAPSNKRGSMGRKARCRSYTFPPRRRESASSLSDFVHRSAGSEFQALERFVQPGAPGP